MKELRLLVLALGMCLVLLPACSTTHASAPADGGERESVQFLYRSSGFWISESYSSILLVLEKQETPGSGRFVLVATFRYNDSPQPHSLVIAADGQAEVLRDAHPRTARRVLGARRFTTRLILPLDRELVDRLGRAERVVVEGGGQRINLTERELGLLQELLGGKPGV